MTNARSMRPRRALVLGSCTLAAAGLAAGLAVVPEAQAARPGFHGSRHSTFAELSVVGGGAAGRGGAELVTAPTGRSLARPDSVPASASDTTIARAHLARVAPLWGIDGGAASLRATSTSEVSGIGPVVRFAQLVDGVPVYGGGLVVSLDDEGGLQSVGGETTESSAALDFAVPSAKAASVARGAAAARLGLPANLLRTGTPFRYAYDPELVGKPAGPVIPVWRVAAVLPRSQVRAEVLVDARDGSVVEAGGATESLSRAVCDGHDDYASVAAYGYCGQNNVTVVRDTNRDGVIIHDAAERAFYRRPIDGSEPVVVPIVRTESGPASAVTAVNNGFDTLGEVSAFYSSVLGYDLTSKVGSTESQVGGIGSTKRLSALVRYCDPVENYYPYASSYAQATAYAAAYCPTPNAGWYDVDANWDPASAVPYPGGQMAIGRGLEIAEDVIGHEVTHGVTAATNHLIYNGQPGAINESMSDVFGQLIQEFSEPPSGADAGADPGWLIGDKLTADPNTRMLSGPIRSMSNPATTTLAEGTPQPDRMTSALWDEDRAGKDFGGVHSNSGVGNKAAYLIAHGGTFNGTTVRALDPASSFNSPASTQKVARLYWATQQLLPSNANYRRLAMTLVQACQQLVAQHSPGYTPSDCTDSVAQAVGATEMNRSKVATSASRASVAYGKSVKITAGVTDLRGGSAGSANVRLQAQNVGASAWATVATGTTSAGVKVWTVKPTRSTNYRTLYLGGDGFAAVVSASRKVTVTPVISRTVTHPRIAFGRSFTVSGTLRPNRGGKVVKLQQKVNGTWRTVKKVKLTKKSKYKVTYRPRSRADRYFRVYRPAGGTYGSGASTRFKIRVR